MANEMRDRLKENISIIKQHNERGLPVKHITKGEKYEVEVIAEIVEDVSLIIEKMENETLIELPCKVGDKVYFIDTCTTAEDFGKKYVSWGEVLQLSFNGFGKWVVLTSNRLLNIDEVFPTKAEAEAKLKEMRGGNG